MQELGAEILRLCLEAGGSISGEHGIGSDKRCYLDWMFSRDDLETMQLVRAALDPTGIANPGKIFPTPRGCGEASRTVRVLQAEGVPLPEALEVF